MATASTNVRPRRRQAMPQRIAPMLAVGVDSPPHGDYTYEFKWDGVRALTFINSHGIRLQSRNQLDITAGYPELGGLGDALGRRAILDGEIIASDASGHPSFALLQRRMHVREPRQVRELMAEVPIFYVIFDLLYLDGQSLLDRPLSERRERLESLALAGPSWQVAASHPGQGAPMLAAAKKFGLEGIVAKLRRSPYQPGRRSPAWQKIKIIQRQEFVIGGWIPQEGGAHVASLLVGYHDEARKLHFAGGVGSGFTAAEHNRLMPLLAASAAARTPFIDLPQDRVGVHHVKPTHVIEVEYRRWPTDGLLQHAVYAGLRDDKPARKVVREVSLTK